MSRLGQRSAMWVVTATLALAFFAGEVSANTLNGSLITQFGPDSDVANPTVPAGTEFYVRNQRNRYISGFPIKPDAIRGDRFATNAEYSAAACAGDPNGGKAYLRLSKSGKASTFVAEVLSGAAACLLKFGATRTTAPFDDPFLCAAGSVGACLATEPEKVIAAVYGEQAMWNAQILDQIETELRLFFNIKDNRKGSEIIRKQNETTSPPAAGGNNRGGSATGTSSAVATVKFTYKKR